MCMLWGVSSPSSPSSTPHYGKCLRKFRFYNFVLKVCHCEVQLLQYPSRETSSWSSASTTMFLENWKFALAREITHDHNFHLRIILVLNLRICCQVALWWQFMMFLATVQKIKSSLVSETKTRHFSINCNVPDPGLSGYIWLEDLF